MSPFSATMMKLRRVSTLRYGVSVLLTILCLFLEKNEAFQPLSRQSTCPPSPFRHHRTRLATSLSVPPTELENHFDDENDKDEDQPDVSHFRKYLESLIHDIRNKRTLAHVMDDELKRMERRWYHPNFSYLRPQKSYEGPAVPPDLSTYALVARAYFRARDPQGVEAVLRRCEEHDLTPTISILTTVMKAWAKADKWDNADFLLNKMERDYAATGEHPPNAFAYTSYLDALSSSQRKNATEISRQARDMMNRMNQLYESGENVHARPNLFTYIACMKCVERAEGVEAVVELLWRLEEEYKASSEDDLLKPKALVYLTAVEAWSRSHGGMDAAKRAHALLRELQQKYEATGDQDYHPHQGLYKAVISAYSKVALSDAEEANEQVDELLLDMEKDPLIAEPHIQIYDYAIKVKDKRRRLGAAEDAHRLLQRASSPDSYKRVIKAYAREGNAYQAEELLNEMDNLSEQSIRTNDMVPPDDVTVAACIHAWAKASAAGDEQAVERADSLVRRIAKMYGNDRASPKVDGHLFNSVIKLWSTSGRPDAGERAEALIDVMEGMANDGQTMFAPTKDTYILALDCWAQSKRKDSGERAQLLLNRMKDAHAKNPRFGSPNLRALSAALISVAGVGDSGVAESIFREMIDLYREGDRTSSVDGRSLTNVLRCIVRNHRSDWYDRAIGLLQEVNSLHDSGIKVFGPNTIAYNCVLHGLATEGSTDRAEKLFDEMKQCPRRGIHDTKPDIITYSSLVKSWIKSEKPEGAVRASAIFEEVDRKFNEGDQTLQPNRRFCNNVVHALTANAHDDPLAAEKAVSVLERMERDGVQPDLVTYSGVAALLARTHCDTAVSLAEDILRKVEALASDGSMPQPNSAFYSSIMLVYARSKATGALQKGEELLRHVDQLYSEGKKRARPTTHLFNVLMGGWATSGAEDKVEKACALLERIKTTKGLKPITYSYNWVILATARSTASTAEMKRKHFDVALENFRAMHAAGAKPNEYTYSYFMKACNRLLPKGDVEKKLVEDAFRLARRNGFVSRDVLTEVRRARSSPESEEEPSIDQVDIQDVASMPESWFENVFSRNRPR